jgi:hypothetical protein
LIWRGVGVDVTPAHTGTRDRDHPPVGNLWCS